MTEINYSNGVKTIGKRVWIEGKELPEVPSKRNGYNQTVINQKIYIDGYEYKNGQWKRTLKALWYALINNG